MLAWAAPGVPDGRRPGAQSQIFGVRTRQWRREGSRRGALGSRVRRNVGASRALPSRIEAQADLSLRGGRDVQVGIRSPVPGPSCAAPAATGTLELGFVPRRSGLSQGTAWWGARGRSAFQRLEPLWVVLVCWVEG